MHLSCLVVSRDPEVLKGVGDVFTGFDLVFRRDAAGANDAISQNHLDAFVIDCDGVERSTDLLSSLKAPPMAPATLAAWRSSEPGRHSHRSMTF